MIKNIKGNVFNTEADIIAHQVNCKGVMGSGIARQIKQKYPIVYKRYLEEPMELGTVLIVDVSGAHKIANLYAQDDYGYDGKQYTDIDALRSCFKDLNDYAEDYHCTIAMPYKIGCDRGGADWNTVYQMIEDIFDVDVELWRLN